MSWRLARAFATLLAGAFAPVPAVAQACAWDYAPNRDPRAIGFSAVPGGAFGPWLIHCRRGTARSEAGCTMYYDFGQAQMGLNLEVTIADPRDSVVNFGSMGSLGAATMTIASAGGQARRLAFECQVTELTGRIDGRGWPTAGTCPAYTICRPRPGEAGGLIEQLVAGRSATLALQPRAGPLQTVDLDLSRLREAWAAYWRFRAPLAAR